METGILVVWWIGLLGALALTVVAVAEIIRVVHHALEIKRLAREVLPAAGGIAANTALITDLEGVTRTGGRLLGAVETLGRTAASIENHAGTLRSALSAKGKARS